MKLIYQAHKKMAKLKNAKIFKMFENFLFQMSKQI